MSVLTKHQVKQFGPKQIEYFGEPCQITAQVRYDDQCGNGHNSFAITGDIRRGRNEIAGGMLHDEIAEAFPELAPYLKWHLCSSDGPMHYIANTVYWVKEGNLDFARSTAIWPEATGEQLADVDALTARLPELLAEFQKAVESLGFTY